MIVMTYLFSQGIANSGLIDQIFQPLLLRLVHTPWQCLLAVAAMFYLTMYVIPAPGPGDHCGGYVPSVFKADGSPGADLFGSDVRRVSAVCGGQYVGKGTRT